MKVVSVIEENLIDWVKLKQMICHGDPERLLRFCTDKDVIIKSNQFIVQPKWMFHMRHGSPETRAV